MRAFVFTDAALTTRAGQFVWLDLNFDDAKNAAIVERLGTEALPAFYVVNPADESVVLRVIDSMNVAELGSFLDHARTAVQGTAPASPLDAALLNADRLDAAGKTGEAALAYRDVMSKAPAAWPPYGRVAVALLYGYQSLDKRADCVAAAREALPRLTGTAASVKVGYAGLDCAMALPKDDPAKNAAVSEMERAMRGILASPPKGAPADDLSAGYLSLISARKAAGDSAGAQKEATAWAQFLEAQAAAATTPQQRTVFDSHRMSAYFELGEPGRAVPMLQQSERDLPSDYNPPARLASAYLRLQRYDEALAASDRALAKVTGPRRLQVFQVRANILVAKGDPAAARTAIEQAIAYAESLPAAQRSEGTIAALKKRLGELQAKSQ